MKDASHALNSGLAFPSSSRKCQVFKMIYCHAVRWGDGQLGNGLREDCAGLPQGPRGQCSPAVAPWASCVAALDLGLHTLRRQFSTSVPQEFLKHTTPDYLVRGTDLFSLRLLNKKMTTTNTAIAVQCERMKIISVSFFL